MNKTEPIKQVKIVPPITSQEDVSAWDMRLAYAKSEVETLTKRKEALNAEAKSLQSSIEQQASQRLAETRKEAAKVSVDRDKLESDKEDFESILIEFRKEKKAFEKEREDILNMKINCEKAESKIGEFVRMVKSGAERL